MFRRNERRDGPVGFLRAGAAATPPPLGRCGWRVGARHEQLLAEVAADRQRAELQWLPTDRVDGEVGAADPPQRGGEQSRGGHREG
jgi:hypothetical protein